ncbi:DUF551 domain-containing protein [Raoultella ornithinolytica]|uniref:DUF551 domain-containing protein n=1 Tax=Raoultella ornithinolytica TaxID=54291 RepID=UPI000FDAF938|nr:DUF551 domain-containing protein [Raoultella ornithinolytica]RVS13735.1 DUF551 domain-containing protein [Raoultella ornithinolytica]
MTNNQLTKEWLQNRIADMESTRDDIPFGFDESGNNELAAFKLALAAMDSEPVGKPFMYGIADPDGNAYIDEFCVSEDLGLVEDTVNELNYDREEGDELNSSVVALYRHAQPAPEREQLAIENFRSAMEGIGHIRRTLEETFGGLHGTHVEPDVLMECKTICDAIYAAYRGSAQGVPEEKLMPNSLSMYAVDAVAAIAEVRGWNAFRAATLQAGNSPVIPEWIPVSERMPEKNGTYQVWNGEHVGAVPFLFGSFQCLNPEQVTHWMPTAKPPREVK